MMRPVRRALAVLGLVLAAAGGATAQSPPGEAERAATTSAQVIEVARTSRPLQEWLADHPTEPPTATRDPKTDLWTIRFTDAKGKVQAEVFVSDDARVVTETRTGPQVAWQMARGYPGAFGRGINDPEIWLPLLAVFLIPLLSWRRLVSWRTLDLLALCAFSVSLLWFNRGEIFTSVPLAYPPMVYLALRLVAIGLRGDRGPITPDGVVQPRPVRRPRLHTWCPTWLLVALMLVAVGLRLGLNAFDSNVIDVGYAGVIGADRIAHGQTPYGTFPSDCGQCDTYGPLTYLTYVPFEQAMPWVGKWNDLPAAHGAAVMFDLVALLGMIVLGWRLGGRHLAAGLGLAWAAFPFTAYALESNSNDSLVAACLVWGLVFAHRPAARGLALGLAIMSKFSPAILIALWSRHPFPRGTQLRRRLPGYLLGLGAAAVATGWVLALDGADGFRSFWSRTLGYQLDRESPFSIWGQYTWLRPVQLTLAGIVAVFALWLAIRPRRLDLRGFAALSGALLLGIQLTMTHWFYLYIPWFVPFALLAMVPEWPIRIRQTPPVAAPVPDEPQVLPTQTVSTSA